MANVMPCPNCQARLLMQEGSTARKVRCPKCKMIVDVTAQAPVSVAASLPVAQPDEDVRPVVPKRPAPRPAPRPVADLPTAEIMEDTATAGEDTPVEPRRRKRRRRRYYEEEPVKKQRPPWFWALSAAGGFMTIVFVAVIFLILSRMNLLPDVPTLVFGMVIMVPISCVILVLSMFISSAIAGGIDFGAFHWAILKAILLLVVVNFVGAIPFVGWVLTFPVWVFGLMVLYELDFWETRFLVFINWVLNTLAKWAVIAMIVAALSKGGIEDPGLVAAGALGGTGSPTANRMLEMEREKEIERQKALALEAKVMDKWEALGAKMVHDPNNAVDGVVLIILSGSRVTDDDLVDLKAFRDVKTLEVGQSLITDKGLAHLKEVKWLTMLGAANSKLTDAGITDLKKSNPGLAVLR